MKNPEEYIIREHKCIWMPKYEEVFRQSDIIEYIKLAQKEAYNQAIEDALNNVELNLKSTDENAVYYKKAISCEFNGYSSTITVNKDSILKLKINNYVR